MEGPFVGRVDDSAMLESVSPEGSGWLIRMRKGLGLADSDPIPPPGGGGGDWRPAALLTYASG
jgi:hypothetical protein